jgi:hypothetical protein
MIPEMKLCTNVKLSHTRHTMELARDEAKNFYDRGRVKKFVD